MWLSHDGDAWIVQGAPSTMLRMVPLPRCGRGGWGSHIPSPCGDVVLKLVTYYNLLNVDGEFPSPCGDVVLKCKLTLGKRLYRSQFPSPCGDVVLKSLPREVLRRVAQSAVLRRGCVSPPFSCGNTFYKQLYPARLYVRRGSPLQYSTEPPAVQAVCCAWTRLTAASARRAALSQDNASSRARRYPRGR